ncbi:MAG TPA: cyclic nucleotide-binding domain-containing protein [Vicinamibacteria bacterium]|nr:cyclic nucleotide-binding domain-containing protein [Vicinamibacteria bacterium]
MPEVRTYLEALMALDETPLRLDPGQAIFNEGEPGHEMFVVRTGTVDLKVGDTVLETVGQGGVFGEMALVDPAPRSATAVAGPGCSLVLVDERSFNELLRRVPSLGLEIMRVMARRLRRASHPA